MPTVLITGTSSGIGKAATSKSTDLRYPVGKPAPMLLRLRKILSDRLWFGIIRRNYKI